MRQNDHRHTFKKIRIRREDGLTRLIVARSAEALNRSPGNATNERSHRLFKVSLEARDFGHNRTQRR
jgi:hypothetical protein